MGIFIYLSFTNDVKMNKKIHIRLIVNADNEKKAKEIFSSFKDTLSEYSKEISEPTEFEPYWKIKGDFAISFAVNLKDKLDAGRNIL